MSFNITNNFVQFIHLFTLDYLSVLIHYPIKPIDNIIYFFIRNCYLSFNLFPLYRRREGVFLFVEFKHMVNERDKFVVARFFRGVLKVYGANGELIDNCWFD